MNTPVPGVTLPIAAACKPPVVAVVNVVAPVTPSVELNVPVVNVPAPENVVADKAPVLALYVRLDDTQFWPLPLVLSKNAG